MGRLWQRTNRFNQPWRIPLRSWDESSIFIALPFSQPLADFRHKYLCQIDSGKTSLNLMEQRRELRENERLVVTINGRDKTGQCFTEQVVATGISRSGALLSGISRQVRSGDLLWVEHKGKKSRFKVVWLRDSGSLQLIQAAVHLLDTERCPWQED